MTDARSGGGIGQGDMYHILAPQCHGQDSTPLREYHPLGLAAADPPGLVHSPAPVFACVERVDQQMHLAGASRRFDLVGAVDQIARARLHSEAVEGSLAQRVLGPLAELPHLTEQMLVTLGKAGIKTLDDLADLATDELIQKKRVEPRRREPSNRPEDKGGILSEYGLSEEQGNEIIMAARAHWFEDDVSASDSGDGPQQQEDAVAENDQ